MKRRQFMQMSSLVLAVGTSWSLSAVAKSQPTVEVWKTATCGCCHDWVAHLQAH
jgi:hypothetical protein